MEYLNSESFRSLQELAEVQRQLAAVRAEIEALRSTKNTFLANREAEAMAIVDNVLSVSRAALEEAEKNRDAIASLLAASLSVAETVKVMESDMSTFVTQYETAINKTTLTVQTKVGEIATATEQLKSQRQSIQDDERHVQTAKEKILRDRLLIEDRKRLLTKEIDRLKNIK